MTVKELKDFLSKIPPEQDNDKVVIGLYHGWFPVDEVKEGIVSQTDFEFYDFKDNDSYKESLESMKNPKSALIFNYIE